MTESVRSGSVEEVFAEEKFVLALCKKYTVEARLLLGMAVERCLVSTPDYDVTPIFRNGLKVVGPEVILIKRIVGAVFPDVGRGEIGQVFAIFEAFFDELSPIIIPAVDSGTLSEVEFALGDFGSDDDGGRVGIGDGGLKGPVESSDSEPRDRVQGEGPRPTGGKIIRGGHCQRFSSTDAAGVASSFKAYRCVRPSRYFRL